SRIASCMVFSLSCRCELVPVRRDRLRRLFGLGPQSRPGSRLATVCLAPERNRSLAGDFFRGCCAAAPENFFLREHGTDTLFDIQERQDGRGMGDRHHRDYQSAFEREVCKRGRQNPEIRRNYYLEDTVEEGNFVSCERLLSCERGSSIIVPFD